MRKPNRRGNGHVAAVRPVNKGKNKWQPVGGHNNPAKTMGLVCPTGAIGGFDNIAENFALSNPKMPDLPNENAASGATDHGVKNDKKRDISPRIDTPNRRVNAMALYGEDRHKRAAKAFGYVLTVATSEAWEGFVTILLARLSKGEREALACAALVTLDDDTAYRAASMALFGVLDGEVLA